MQETFQHLIELRRRLLRYVLVFFVVACAAVYFAKSIYYVIALPMMNRLGDGVKLISTSVPAPFLIPLKTALVASVFLTIPYLLHQLWCFVAPALYRDEKRFAWLLLVTSIILFYAGVLFAYFIVLPVVFNFLLAVAPVGVEVRPDISLYYDFVIRMFFAFGFSFEVPVLILLLTKLEICSIESLASKRPYVIVLSFVVGMLLTPPDVVSQIMLAVPLWLLFELGLGLARLFRSKRVVSL